MKSLFLLIISIAMLSLPGNAWAGPNELTVKMAQRAVDKFFGKGVAKVDNIEDSPMGGTHANFTVNNFRLQDGSVFSGKGDAAFTLLQDGHWIMETAELLRGYGNSPAWSRLHLTTD